MAMNKRGYFNASMLALLAAGLAFADDETNGVSEAEFASRWTIEVGTRYGCGAGDAGRVRHYRDNPI